MDNETHRHFTYTGLGFPLECQAWYSRYGPHEDWELSEQSPIEYSAELGNVYIREDDTELDHEAVEEIVEQMRAKKCSTRDIVRFVTNGFTPVTSLIDEQAMDELR